MSEAGGMERRNAQACFTVKVPPPVALQPQKAVIQCSALYLCLWKRWPRRRKHPLAHREEDQITRSLSRDVRTCLRVWSICLRRCKLRYGKRMEVKSPDGQALVWWWNRKLCQSASVAAVLDVADQWSLQMITKTDAFRSEKNLCCFVATVCFFFSNKYRHTNTLNNRHGSS